MVDLAGLNPPQYEAVTTIHGSVMILAGAGTGKTRVISYRIAHMVRCGVPPDQIVALTFTNKAAREMLERVRALTGRGAKGLRIGTFHSFCLSILRAYPHQADLDPRFSLIGTAEQIDMVRRGLEEKGWHGLYKPDVFLTRISNAKNNMLSPEDLRRGDYYAPHFEDEDPSVLAEIYDTYERQLRLNRVIDFDDCIFRTVKLVTSREDVREDLQRKHTHYLVDEFQDTNFSQLTVLEHLAGRYQNICVVGDDDQSIYSWRGAMVETLERFEQIFKGTRLIKLEQNYRCSNVILNAANTVIKNNRGRKEKTLWSTSEIENPILLAAFTDDIEEAKWVAQRCFGLLGQGYKPKDIGILYRANAQARALEVALREYSLKYKIYGGSSFFEKKEVKDFLAYVKLTINPDDRLSFWRVINTPTRGIGLKSLEKIEEAARQHDVSPYEAARQGLVDLPPKIRAAVDEFIEGFESVRGTVIQTEDDLEARGLAILKTFHLEDDIRQKITHDGARQRKLESIRRLPGWLKQISANMIEEKGLLDLRGLLDQLTLSDEDKSQSEKGDNNHISLMSIHGSKGLEFPIVFVCGIEEEQLPHKNSLHSEAAISEERRLFYVALTRAKEKLHLSYARERFSGFQKNERKPSRFLKELPVNGVVIEQGNVDAKFVSADQRKANNLQRLSSLKESLQTGFVRSRQ